MKTIALCVVCGGLAFVAVQFQMTGTVLGFALQETAPPPPPPPPKAKFPEALAVVCRGMGVPQAAPFKWGADAHPAVVLKPNGALHPWHDRLQSGWQAESVEEAELVIMIPPQQKKLLQIQTYANGAPPIRRFQYDVDVRVVEAKTGKLVAFRHFQNSARPIRPNEVWALTELGDAVTFRDVYRWIQKVATKAPGSPAGPTTESL